MSSDRLRTIVLFIVSTAGGVAAPHVAGEAGWGENPSVAVGMVLGLGLWFGGRWPRCLGPAHRDQRLRLAARTLLLMIVAGCSRRQEFAVSRVAFEGLTIGSSRQRVVRGGNEIRHESKFEFTVSYSGHETRVEREMVEVLDGAGGLKSIIVDPSSHPKAFSVSAEGVLMSDDDGRKVIAPRVGARVVGPYGAERAIRAVSRGDEDGAQVRVFGLDVDLPRAEVLVARPGRMIPSDCPVELQGTELVEVERDVGVEHWVFDSAGELMARRQVRAVLGCVWIVRCPGGEDRPELVVPDVTSRVVPGVAGPVAPSAEGAIDLRIVESAGVRGVPTTSSQDATLVAPGVWRVRTRRPEASRVPFGSRSIAGGIEERLRTITGYSDGLRRDGAAAHSAIADAVRAHMEYESASWAADAVSALSSGRSNCVGFSCIVAEVAGRVRVESRMVSGFGCVDSGASSPRLVPHRWVELLVDGEWQVADASDGGLSDWRIAFAVWPYRTASAWADGIRALAPLDYRGVRLEKWR